MWALSASSKPGRGKKVKGKRRAFALTFSFYLFPFTFLSGGSMSRICTTVLALMVAAPAWAVPAYSIKVAKAEPPREVPAAFAKLLGADSVQLLDKDNKPICNLWICKDVPGATTDAQ